MKKSVTLREQARAELGQAKAIAEAAAGENREMTGEQFAEYQKHYDAAKNLGEQAKAADRDEQVLSAAKALSDELGLGEQAAADLDAQAKGDSTGYPTGVKSLGSRVIGSQEFKSLMAQFKGGLVPERAAIQSAPIHMKALLTGADLGGTGGLVPADRLGLVETLGRRPLTIRDLISVRRTASDTIEYVVQTGHTNAAAPVPEATSSAFPEADAVAAGRKPEGAWAFARRTTSVVTIAEWVPATKRALADVAQLEGLINDELVTDLAEEEETQILNGDGTGENLTGILATSGIQTRAAGGDDLFVALRRAIGQARIGGRVAPNAILVNPAEMEAVELMRDANGNFFGGGPYGGVQPTLWGVRVVESENMPAGTALVGDFTKAVLWDREAATVTMTDSHADYFVRNLVAILAEERVAFAVTRPTAFVTVTGLGV